MIDLYETGYRMGMEPSTYISNDSDWRRFEYELQEVVFNAIINDLPERISLLRIRDLFLNNNYDLEEYIPGFSEDETYNYSSDDE